ncbi:hypothetical protein DMP23_43595 [Amycolatopsis sp. A1MSW2902]
MSPQASGGAGTIDEYRLATIAMVALLRGDALAGLAQPVLAVGLQRREAGNTLDDLVLQAALDHDSARVEYQVKRTMSPQASDKAFVDALRQCQDALEARSEEIAAQQLRLGLATTPSGPVDQLRRLTELARDHATLVSFEALLKAGAVNKDVRDRFDKVVEAVAAAQLSRGKLLTTSDFRLLTFTMLKAMHVWQFEVGEDGRDTLNALNRLADILPEGQTAKAAFDRIAEFVDSWGPNAALIDPAMLRAALARHGIALTVEPKQRTAWAKLSKATEAELESTQWAIGQQLALPRHAALQQVKDAISANQLVLVAGPAGVGKSVLARRAVKDVGTAATTVVVDLAGHGREPLAALNAELGVDLAEALRAVATTAPRILMIDGAEHALVDYGRLLKAVLRAVPLDSERAPEWTVVLTTRSDAVDAVRQHLPTAPAVIEVKDLGDREVEEIVEAFPELLPLTRNARSERLLRRPYLADLLVRTGAALADRPLGEEDVMGLVWKHVVRQERERGSDRGTPHARADACLRLAEDTAHAAASSGLRNADGTAVDGLLTDDVLVRHRTRYRFAHDILLDYTLAMWLLDGDLSEPLSQTDGPRRLIRSVRLALQTLLSDEPDAVRCWNEIVAFADTFAGHGGERWSDLPYEAVLAMGNPQPVLSALEPEFLTNDGARLFQLLKVVCRFATTSEPEPDQTNLQLDVLLAAPVVNLLAEIGTRVPERVTTVAAEVVRRWLMATIRTGASLEDHVANPPGLSRAVAAWSGSDVYGDRLAAVLPSLALLGRHHTPEAQAVFDRIQEHNRELWVIVEDPEVPAAAAAANPDLLLLLAGRYYLDQSLTLDPADTPPAAVRKTRRSSAGSLSNFAALRKGVRGHEQVFRRADNVGLAAPHYGPFAALLRSSSSHGRRLVGAVLDAASTARTAVERTSDEINPTFRLNLSLWREGEPIAHHGTTTTWAWFRRTGNGDYPAMSAAMALAEWAIGETTTRAVGSVALQVLRTSTCLGVVPIALALLVERLEETAHELDAFLEQPLVWEMEHARHVREPMAYPLKGYERLSWEASKAALALVTRSDADDQKRLHAVGNRMVEKTLEELAAVLGEQPAKNHPTLLIARRRALSLQRDALAVSRSDGGKGIVIGLDVPDDIEEGLQPEGNRALLNLTVASLTTRAVQIRDGKSDEQPEPLWTELTETLAALDACDESYTAVNSPDDARAAVAAAIITAGGTALLTTAVTALLDVIESPQPDPDALSTDRSSAWPLGADRSAATALTHVLATDSLRAIVDLPRIEGAIRHLAAVDSEEVRQRLVRGFQKALNEPCGDHPDAHDIAMETLTQLARHSGMGPWHNDRRDRVVLAEPLRDALDDDVLDLDEAADVLPGVATASRLPCRHGDEATALMSVFVDHDLSVWPDRYARKHYDGIEQWRDGIDQYVAELVADGDHNLLNRYLSRFAPVAEELAGLLTKLAEIATTVERAEVVFSTHWPVVFDHLLPANRDLREQPDPPRTHYVQNLDRALLPIPDAGRPWPSESLLAILDRWVQAFEDHPRLADHVIIALSRYDKLRQPVGTGIVLRVLGDDIARISRQSKLASTWLHLALLVDKAASEGHQERLLSLLDRLAQTGDSTAIEVQRELELQ